MSMVSNVGGFASIIFYAFFRLYGTYRHSHFEVDSVKKSFKIRKNKVLCPEMVELTTINSSILIKLKEVIEKFEIVRGPKTVLLNIIR